MQQDPYKIMGVKETDTIEHIDNIYNNFMMILHPDRENSSSARILNMTREEKVKYMQLIRESYKNIIDLKKREMNYPDYDVSYNLEELRISNVSAGEKFDSNKFNMAFSNSIERDKKAGMTDPFNKGYNMFDSRVFDDKNVVSMPTRAELTVITPSNLQVPNNDHRLTEFQAIGPSQNGINYTELGLANVSDFSMSTVGKGKLEGTDLMSVYGKNYERWEDTVKRDSNLFNKFNDTSDISTKMKQIRSGREDKSVYIVDKNILEAERKQKIIDENREKLRQLTVSKRDSYFNDINRGQLSWK
jgi:hypothetical protein